MDGTFLWVSLTSFRHLALSIGLFQSQELVHLFLDTRSIHCTIAFFYSFSGLLYEKDKKIKYNKKSGNGMYLRYFDGSTESVLSPLNKAHILIYISFIWDGFSFDLGSAFTMFHLSVLPRLVISSNHMESLFCLLQDRLIQCHFLLPWSSQSRAFVQGKSSLSRPFCGVSWLIIQSAFPVLSVSCSITSDVLVFCSCWFEKVPIDFLPAGLSLIDYDTLLWEQT